VVLNVTMPLVNGFEAAKEIKKQIPETAIVILSSHAEWHSSLLVKPDRGSVPIEDV
jgi:YesN/AraC family two-component response regulator